MVLKLTISEIIINYYDRDTNSLKWRISDYLENLCFKYDPENLTKNSGKIKYFIYHIMIAFLCIMLICYIALVFIAPQLIVYPWYQYVCKKYQYVISLLDLNTIPDTNDIEKWCDENEVDALYFYKLFNTRIILFFKNRTDDRNMTVGFKSKEDAMAFKLKWS